MCALQNNIMCGISGFNWKDEQLIKTMSDSIAHRGPDAQGFFCDDGVSFGHNRLSIIDLSVLGNQPMKDNDDSIVLMFNGEIYNFQELRNELTDYEFKSKSDTEVIIAGYKKWGKEVFEKLNGMFAIALWDKKEKTLMVARDRFGVKPLYYFWDEKRFMFASEVKALLTHDILRKLNKEAFNHYIRVLYVPEPLTMIQGISKLPPGEYITLKEGEFTIQSFIKGKFGHKSDKAYSELRASVHDTVIRAVKRQLVSDVPLGVYLSGGIDSSVVLASMKKFQKNINTFSVGFDLPVEGEQEKFNEDFNLAQKTADFFKVNHHSFTMNEDDVVNSFMEMAVQNDDPISNPTSIAMMYLAKRAKEKVTVVLSGDGGDELFGGYRRYRLALVSSLYMKLPSYIRSILNVHSTLRKFEYKNEIDLFARFHFVKDKVLQRVISESVFKPDSVTKEFFFDRYLSKYGGDLVEKFMQVDKSSWLPDQALLLADKMAMKSAIEQRVPFLDNEVLSLSNTIRRGDKVTMFDTKKILKDAFRKELPQFLFNQPKRGWFSPGAKWLRLPKIKKMAEEILSRDYYSGTENIFRWDELATTFQNHVSKEEYNVTILWVIMTFQVWAKHYQITE